MLGKHVLIGGGTGFIGSRLTQHLLNCGYEVTVVSRMPGVNRITWHDIESCGVPKNITSVVNLAGQNVLDPTRRWTPGFKQNVWNSRINSTVSLVRAISKPDNCVETFVNISGVSLYKPDNDKIYTEKDGGECFDFMSELCLEWEKVATIPGHVPCRGVKLRTGVVIGKNGGMVQSIKLPFWLGLGGPMGTGKQPLPWIHILDLCRLIQFSMENKSMKGAVNGVAPECTTNGQFSKTFAQSLRRPCVFAVPEFVVNCLFGKERSALLLTGAYAQPQKALENNFQFQFPTVKEACDDVISS